jgi:hypothetical protein
MSVSGVMDRLGSSTVAGAHICSPRDDRTGNSSRMRRGSDVQCRVPGIDMVVNRRHEVRVGILAGRSEPNCLGGEGGRCVELSGDLLVITCSDSNHQRKQYTVVEGRRRLT